MQRYSELSENDTQIRLIENTRSTSEKTAQVINEEESHIIDMTTEIAQLRSQYSTKYWKSPELLTRLQKLW